MTLRSARGLTGLKLGRHKVQQILPTGKEPVAGQGLQIVEESLPCSQQGTDVLIGGITEVQDRVKQEGQQVERHEQLRQIGLAMPEVAEGQGDSRGS